MHKDMLRELKSLGVREGGDLLVHSSYKSLGPGVKDIEQVINTLKEALGKHGNLLFPTLSYASVTRENPHFDILNTPSCVGAIPEWFRKQPGVLRSMHPTHSVAVYGPCAKEITADHHLDNTPVGRNSPFRKLRDKNGQILMLGCGLMPSTSMHGVEELTMPPYVLKHAITYTCVGLDGNSTQMGIQRHHFETKHGERLTQRYDRLKYVLPKDVLRMGKVLDAECCLIEAKPMWDIAEAVLACDPLFFVDCPVD